MNVRLQASVGVVLAMQRSIPNSGEILLYVEASVKVSVKASINLGLFSISISFSFNASFRFEWKLLDQQSNANVLAALGEFAALPPVAAPAVLPLCAGFTADLPLWYLPEATVVFPESTGTGSPWLVSSLGTEFDPQPPKEPTYADFKPFEKLTAQLVTWALWNVQGQPDPADSFTMTLGELTLLDQNPEKLVGWIDYSALLAELAVFAQAEVTFPTKPTNGTELNGTVFAMPPFLHIATNGRLNASKQADDLDFTYSSKNGVTQAYVDSVSNAFNQLFVNQEQSSNGNEDLTAGTKVPLSEVVFVNYFTGLVRSGVHELLVAPQNSGKESEAVNALIIQSVGTGTFASLAGQMSSSFRGGLRFPYTDGLTVPGGTPLPTTNPLYALLWQEFPVGTLDATTKKYSVKLTNADAQQTWLKSDVTWDLTESWVVPYTEVTAEDILAPTAPTQLPFTDIGPPAFAFENAIVWTQSDDTAVSLRPASRSMATLQQTTSQAISMLVQSRPAGQAFMAPGTPLPRDAFTWATRVDLSISQVPDTQSGGAGRNAPLADVFALSGASQQDQALLEMVIRELEGNDPIESIQILYQESAGASGLTSKAVNTDEVFALRTNTTTVTAPPVSLNLAFALTEQPGVPVGATIDEDAAFLQIIQQSAVTNAAGYLLRYIDVAGDSLPTKLFTGGPAPLTILITYKSNGDLNTSASPSQVQPFYNAIVLHDATDGLVYYAEPTEAKYYVQQSSVAPGAIGVVLTRDDAVMTVAGHHPSAAKFGVESDRRYHHAELLTALVESGVSDEAQLQQALADVGGPAAQLNALYNLVTYQVQKSAGFIESPLSAPIQPQQPDSNAAQADGIALADDDETRLYRVYTPLYNLATDNQPPPPTNLINRYASLGETVTMDFYQNDAFGNQMPSSLPFSAPNLYFDPLITLDQWQGVVTTYDFAEEANRFAVHLAPDNASFEGLTAEAKESAFSHWTSIKYQIEGKGVSFYVETNLALDGSGNMVQLPLDVDQTKNVTDMVNAIVAWFENGGTFRAKPVDLTMTATGSGTVPPVFEISVLFGIERDPDLISPLIKDANGNITFPSAQNANSSIVSTVTGTAGGVNIQSFATDFETAFPQLVLSVGPNGAEEPSRSSANRARALLAREGIASDGSGASQKAPQSLWAVQKRMTQIEIGADVTSDGPFYLSPKPLDNALSTGVVPLPELPSALKPSNWPTEQLFTDVDLDQYNRPFFQAVDNILAAEPAAQAFEQSRSSYTVTAEGRKSIADQYAQQEVDWLFGSDAPFTGTDLKGARETFGQQMRESLMTAYSVDTIVQYIATWKSLPDGVGDAYALYGHVVPTAEDVPKGYTFSSAKITLADDGKSPFTFLFGVADIQDTESVTVNLEYRLSHVEYFLEPASSVPPGEARPSIWLQLVNPETPHVGPATTPTEIPLVFRQFPTPPTVIDQVGLQGETDNHLLGQSNPFPAAAAWYLRYRYQVQLTAHDQALTEVTYNTNLRTGTRSGTNELADGVTGYTLFESLARFHATYAVLLPVLSDLTNPNWSKAVDVLANLVVGVETNTTWNPVVAAQALDSLVKITDKYTVTDRPTGSGEQRLITLSWTENESSFPGATLNIQAIAPNGTPYPNQSTGRTPDSITDTYTPIPSLIDDWVIHEVGVDNLNVLVAENARAGLQVVRNRIVMQGPGGTDWPAQAEFMYKTSLVKATGPVTPFVDNDTPIDIATLPPPPEVTAVAGAVSLTEHIYTLLYDLLADEAMVTELITARLRAGQDESVERRLKMACGFQYPVKSASGVTSSNPIAPIYPVKLARSFDIDANQNDQLKDLAALYGEAVAAWAAREQLKLGSEALPDATFVFDITLYAQLSGLNTPVLRLGNLRLKLSDITP